ncbi:MAG: prepilin-type N-terminal cleavage/methylation domain-containing protein [Alphaproteobacteria bacterium]|nr:prepilin-type N-terminal cleavage/methylation domain-containing protein [Alphaproteobacteria bacterium]
MKQVRKFNQVAAKLGFTLIELSIVLVIIGLIVGGILVGQDLIKAAEIRATVSQMEKYATAVNTFRSKYNGLPGDLLNASNFGFDVGTPLRDGDAQIESSPNTAGTFGGEAACFWDDLSTANLIAESLNASAACGASWSPSVLASVIPIAKLGRGNYLVIGGVSGINYWGLTGVSSISSAAYTFDDLLTGSESFQIDSKIDDGAPTSGAVIAVKAESAGTSPGLLSTADSAVATPGSAGDCVLGNNTYNFAISSGNDQGCQLRLRSNF